MRLIGGYTNYGESIGILMLDTRFPRPPGDIGNARSYDFPVRYKIVKNAYTDRIMGHSPDPGLIEPFVEAARELESEGVKAITTSCGFLAPFQKHLAEAVNIPVFASSLLQAPLIHVMIGGSRPIGIFTERAEFMADDHFKGVGWSSDTIPVFVKGMKPDAVFPKVYIGNSNELDTRVLIAEMEEMTREFIKECPDAGAILFECTNMCPFASHVRAISGLPIFDINTLIHWVQRSVEPRRFLS